MSVSPNIQIVTLLPVCLFVLADVLEGKSAILLGMSQWNSNDLVEQIETLGHMDQSQGMLHTGYPGTHGPITRYVTDRVHWDTWANHKVRYTQGTLRHMDQSQGTLHTVYPGGMRGL